MILGVKYNDECIKTASFESSVEKMCDILKVSRSGYYSWLKRPESSRTIKDKKILAILIFILKRQFKYKTNNPTPKFRMITVRNLNF